MLKRILNFIKADIVNATRDNIILYMLIAPVLLALLSRLFLPTLQNVNLTFAVDRHAGQEVINQLKAYGNIELYDTDLQVRERVERPDDVGGIIGNGEKYTILMEGNEGKDFDAIYTSIMDRILRDSPLAQFEHISLGVPESPIRGLFTSFLLLSAVMIAGLIVGFNLIDEKETRAIQALAVSPIKIFEYIIARGVLVLLMALILSLLTSLIMVGFAADYAKLVVGVLFSAALAVALGLLLGGLADNQISGIAILKVLFLVYTLIPMGSLFVHEALQWVFYPFPNYWMFVMFKNIYLGTQHIGFWAASIFTLITSIIYILLMVPVLRRTLKLR